MADYYPNPPRLTCVLRLQFVMGFILLILATLSFVFLYIDNGPVAYYFICDIVTAVLMVFLSCLVGCNCDDTSYQRKFTVRVGISLSLLLCALSVASATLLFCIDYCDENTNSNTSFGEHDDCVHDILIPNHLNLSILFSIIVIFPCTIVNVVCLVSLYLYLKALIKSFAHPSRTDNEVEYIECISTSDANLQHDQDHTYDTSLNDNDDNHILVNTRTFNTRPHARGLTTEIRSLTPSAPPSDGNLTPDVHEPLVTSNDEIVSHLLEQNRLLREQLALQQQLNQQPPLTMEPGSLEPPPPSYEACMKDSSMVHNLEDQNRRLQAMYSEQQHVLPDI